MQSNRLANVPDWERTAQREIAVRLVTEGEATIEEIAGTCGVSYNTILNWTKRKESQERLRELSKEFPADVQTFTHKERVNVAKDHHWTLGCCGKLEVRSGPRRIAADARGDRRAHSLTSWRGRHER